MTNAPSTEPESPESNSPEPRRRRRWVRAGLTVGAVTLLGVAGGSWWAWVFVNERLSPWASELLTKSLNRPVQLGDVERASLLGVRFGPSALPATETDPDTLYVEAIDVRINPLQLLRRRVTPRLEFTGARAYIEQDERGQWLDLDLDLPERDPDKEPFIQVDTTIQVRDGELVVLPYRGAEGVALPITIENIDGRVAIVNTEVPDPADFRQRLDGQQIDLQISAEPQRAGRLEVRGSLLKPFDSALASDPVANADTNAGTDAELTASPESPWANLTANLAVQGQQLDLAILAPIALTSLPQTLPLTVSSGQLDGSIDIALRPGEAPRITGTARLNRGAVLLDALAQPISAIQGQARFQGNRVALENFTAQLAGMTARAGGLIDTRNGYDLKGEVAPFDLAAVIETLELELPIEAAGIFTAKATVTGSLGKPEVRGNLVAIDTARIDKVDFAKLEAAIAYTHPQLTFETLLAEPLAGGSLTGQGTYTLGKAGELRLQLEGRDLPADEIGRAYGLSEAIRLGTVALDAEISGPLSRLGGVVNWQAPGGTYPTRGRAEIIDNTVFVREAIVQVAGGIVTASGTVARGLWDANLVAQGVQLGQFNDQLQGSVIGGNLDVAGSLADLTLAGLRGSGTLFGTVSGADLNSQVAFANGRWTADVAGRDVPLHRFAPNAPVGLANGDLRLAGTFDDLTLAGIRGEGTVTAAVAGGTVNSAIAFANGLWQAEGETRNLQLAQLNDQLLGAASGTFQLSGSLSDFSPGGVRGTADLVLAEGLASAARFSAPLANARSPLNARLAWDGRQIRIDRAETAGLLASGTVIPRLSGAGSPGIDSVNLNLSARDYALAALPLPAAELLALSGTATFEGRLTGTPTNLNLVGDLQLANLALNDLVFDPLLAGAVRFSSSDGLALTLQGEGDRIVANYGTRSRQLDFQIQAGEALASGETEGDFLRARVYNFPLSVLNLPPAEAAQYGTLRGQVSFASATINLRDFSTVGQVDVDNLGLGYISVDRIFTGFTYANGVAGLNGGEIRMTDIDGQGTVVATRVYQVSGTYTRDRDPQLLASLSTQEGQIQDLLNILKVVEIADFGRSFTPGEGFIPRSREEAEAVLATTAAGDPNASLLNQLRRLSEIIALEDNDALEAADASLPPLEELSGAFAGRVQISASLPTDLAVGFDLQGADWRWGTAFSADQIVARGRFQDGVLQLEPLRLQSNGDLEPAYVSLVGDVSLRRNDPTSRRLAVEVANIPADRLQQPLQIPFPIGGRVNGNAVLRGRLTDPTLQGTLELVSGSLNRNPIDRAEATFSYEGARLALDSTLLLLEADSPLTLSARLPYQPRFVTREPTSYDFRVTMDVQDEGLALLNLFTRQVTWREGKGTVILGLRGVLPPDRLPEFSEFNGLANFEGATIGVQALPEDVTNVNGQIRLVANGAIADNTDREASPLLLPFEVVVDRLSGQFSDGVLRAQGRFPLFVPLGEPEELVQAAIANLGTGEPAPEGTSPSPRSALQPLAIELENVALNLKGQYTGNVDGLVVLGGSLLVGPRLTGDLQLSRGNISIPEGRNGNDPVPFTAAARRGLFFPPLEFEDLEITLENDVRIVQGNLLNFVARGGLTINGPLSDLSPIGVIQLISGRVSLFTSSLRLSGNDNRAEFRGDFEPILNITLRTSVPDASGGTSLIVSSPFPRNEVPDQEIGNLGLTQQGSQTVRIEARVNGPASDLASLRNLELTSSPQRSRTQIISLLSGGFLTALESTVGSVGGEGDNFQGLVSVASFALLTALQDFIGDNIPVSEFRLFPVSGTSGQVNDSFDIGGEVGVDVRPNISVSVLKVLTNDTPFQFNVRYRISNQFTVRGTTSYENFRERTGVLLEYETRF